MLTATLVGALISWLAPSTPVLLVSAILLVLVVAASTKAIVGRLDPFEPLVPFSVMWIVMFFGRPVAMLTSGEMSLRGKYDVSPALTDALWLALLGCVAFVLGYSIRHLSLRVGLQLGDKRVSSKPAYGRFINRLTHTQTMTVIVLFGAASLVVIAMSFGSRVGGSSAYLYFAPLLATPVALLLLALDTRYRFLLRASAAIIIALVVSSYWIAGERFFGLLPLATIAVFYYLARQKRPRLFIVLLVVILLPSLLLLVEGQRTHASSKGFFLDPTTEMLPAFAVEIETRNVVWSETPGYLIYSGAVHWIPGQLWSNKPKTYQESLYSKLFPETYRLAKNGTEFSVLGDFYYDSGIIGVVLGMFFLGLFLRQVYERLICQGQTDLSAAAYAPVPALIIIMLRGDLVLFGGLALYVYIPIAAAKLYAVRSDGSSVIDAPHANAVIAR